MISRPAEGQSAALLGASLLGGSPPSVESIVPFNDTSVASPVILVAMGNHSGQSMLEAHLRAEGYHVVSAEEGEQALHHAEHLHLSLALLDLKLPQRDGLDLCRVLRTQRHTAHLPIMLLAPSDDEADTIIGLEVGADEYIALPYHWPVLRSRIRALLRRSAYMYQRLGEDVVVRTRQQGSEQVVRQGDLCIYLAGHLVTRNGHPIELSDRLFRLLVYFVQHPNIVVTRRQLMEQLHDGEKTLGDERDMTMYIHWLREKLGDDPTHPRYIQTCRGIGYRFTP